MKLKIYEDLCKDINSCIKCDLGENKPDNYDPHVPGFGNLNSKIMFVAEAPGLQETIYKQPLIPPGKSGKIYEKVLSDLGLKREDVYTTNTVLCRPPENEDPLPYQIMTCSQYLDKQIDLIKPYVIVTFGRFAASAFLDDFKITRDHGKVHKSSKYGIDIFPLYHPAYIGAYAPADKRLEFKKDVKLLKRIIKRYLNDKQNIVNDAAINKPIQC